MENGNSIRERHHDVPRDLREAEEESLKLLAKELELKWKIVQYEGED